MVKITININPEIGICQHYVPTHYLYIYRCNLSNSLKTRHKYLDIITEHRDCISNISTVFITMKASKDKKQFLLLLLRNSIVRLIAGTISIAIFLKLGNSISWEYVSLTVKAFGYGFYYYLATPFVIYWLAYVSETKLNKIRFTITVAVTSMYSFVLWDSYFFFKDTLQLFLFTDNPNNW